MYCASCSMPPCHTLRQSSQVGAAGKCHYYGHPLGIRAFYTAPMGLRIKQLREERGWTQQHLAALSKMSRSQLAMIESETRPANTLRLNAIAAAFGLKSEDLFVRENSQARLLELHNQLSQADKEILVRMAEALAAKAAATE